MPLAAVTSQNVAAGKELQVQSLAVTGGTLFVSTVRNGGMDLAAVSSEFVPTLVATAANGAASIATLATAGAGTLTGAQLAGGIISRTSAPSAFTDTTDTAANIFVALPQFVQNSAMVVRIRNLTAFTETLAAGTGVTLAGFTVLPGLTEGEFLLTRTDANTGTPTFTLSGYDVHNLAELPVSKSVAVATGTGTASAGDFTGAMNVAVVYSGQAAIAITTRTAAQMTGDIPNMQVGASYVLTVTNLNTGLLTLTAAAGVTISNILNVQPSCWVEYVVTCTATNTFTFVGVASGPVTAMAWTKFTSINVTTGTLAAGNASGAHNVYLLSTNATPGSQAMRTPAQILADPGGVVVGQSYVLTIANSGAGAFTLATDSGTGFTMTGTMTVAQNTSRTFTVTINSATTGTVQSVATGTWS